MESGGRLKARWIAGDHMTVPCLKGSRTVADLLCDVATIEVVTKSEDLDEALSAAFDRTLFPAWRPHRIDGQAEGVVLVRGVMRRRQLGPHRG